MLSCGTVRYLGAPADLRDIPLGTVMHVRAFLPPDPKTSSVPVLPVNNQDRDVGHYRGTGTAPAENHGRLLEDEPGHCLREGRIRKLKEVTLPNNTGKIIAFRGPTSAEAGDPREEERTFAATRIGRGRERIRVADLVAEETWPASGRKSLDGQAVHLGMTGKPLPGAGLNGAFTQFHISDIGLDDAAIQNAARFQTGTHRVFIRSRWMPARVDAVESGNFGRATVPATLLGGLDSSVAANFQEGAGAQRNGAENPLKLTAGHDGPSHIAANGQIVGVTQANGEAAVGSTGIQIQFETELIIDGLRPGRVVRVRPESWPKRQVPRKEHLFDGGSIGKRFPTPAIFPKD